MIMNEGYWLTFARRVGLSQHHTSILNVNVVAEGHPHVTDVASQCCFPAGWDVFGVL